MNSMSQTDFQNLLAQIIPENQPMGEQQLMMPDQNQMYMPQQSTPHGYDPNFYANLVHKLSSSELATISGNLKRGIDTDLESRSDWEQKLANGIKQLGLVPDTSTQDYSMASNIFSSTFLQSVLTSLAQICSVLLPPGGPVRMKLMNPCDDPKLLKDLLNKSTKISSYMNNMLTDWSPDFYPETEQAFFWSALYGSCFKKVYFDDAQVRPISPLIKPQDLILNSNAVTLLSAPRITHRFYITKKELKMRQMSGMYADVELSPYKNYDNTVIDEILNSIAGVVKNSYEFDETNLYQMLETRVDYPIPKLQKNPNFPCPYIITFEKESGAVVSIRRNWNMFDPYFKRINDIIRYPFFHGLGIYGLGYVHIMGSNAEAATELLRQLIFSGRMANFPAFIRSKGMRMDKSTVRLQPGESAEIDCGNKAVQDCFMKVPVSEPSATLKVIKDDLQGEILKTMNAMNTAVSDINPNAPVGTTLALIEQASKVETSIIKRLHKAMGEELNLIYQLTIHNFDKIQMAFSNEGKYFPLQKDDLVNNFQILPVADPNLSTSTHLLIQSEALSTLYTEFPQLINARSVVEMKLRALKVDNIDTYLVADQAEVAPRDPITENMDMINGKPVKAGLDQNQQGHITTHSVLLTNPAVMNDPNKMAIVQAHIQEHYAMQYQLQMQQLMQGQQVPQDGAANDPQMQNQIAEQAAQVTGQLIQQQQVAISGQQSPLDPNQVLMADIESKKEAMAQKSQIDLLNAENAKYKTDLEFEAKQRELNLKEKEINQKYHLQQSDMDHERNIQEREMLMERLNQENEVIKTQISEIMGKFQSLNAQEMEQQHQKDMQAQQQQHEQQQQMQSQQSQSMEG